MADIKVNFPADAAPMSEVSFSYGSDGGLSIMDGDEMWHLPAADAVKLKRFLNCLRMEGE